MYYGNRQLRIEDLPEPSVSAGEVKIKVSRYGICGSDLHEYYDGPIIVPTAAPHPLTGKAMPLVLGHEFSGVVTAVGAGVTDVPEGDKVAVEPIYRCGVCRPCRSGYYNVRNCIGFHGLMADGGMAEYTVVKRNMVHKLPDSVPVEIGGTR
ncbi:alcohol dehydrogenase catalytic domain-containing protein [Paraburkholderia sp. BR14263]|uniref:alcohol dehydrogenase catalytic domain-containing protein n=1 Tax=unclassified Paraburkholderia TaxID=2615204 RepID=UPI0034CEC1FB